LGDDKILPIDYFWSWFDVISLIISAKNQQYNTKYVVEVGHRSCNDIEKPKTPEKNETYKKTKQKGHLPMSAPFFDSAISNL
jgi:hypothetical protein